MIRVTEEQARELERKWNIIRGCVMASYLEKHDKQRLLKFLESVEETGYEPWEVAPAPRPASGESDDPLFHATWSKLQKGA